MFYKLGWNFWFWYYREKPTSKINVCFYLMQTRDLNPSFPKYHMSTYPHWGIVSFFFSYSKIAFLQKWTVVIKTFWTICYGPHLKKGSCHCFESSSGLASFPHPYPSTCSKTIYFSARRRTAQEYVMGTSPQEKPQTEVPEPARGKSWTWLGPTLGECLQQGIFISLLYGENFWDLFIIPHLSIGLL